jgi:hypothetical protein
MTALLLALALQAAEPPAITPGRVHHDAARGVFVMPPEGWTAGEAETGDGLVFTHPETGARIDVWAEPMGMSGLPGLPDHTLDALRLRLAAPGVQVRGTRALPLAVEADGRDPVEAGRIVALAYEGASGGTRWTGLAATRCGADVYLVLEAPEAAFGDARPVFDALIETAALDLQGGDDFPCAAARD